jgi:hypothetical protein
MSATAFDSMALWVSGLGVINFFLLMYVAFFKLPVVEACLKNCKIVSDTKSLWRGGDPVARLNRLAIISMVFTLGGALSRKGLIDVCEVSRVPAGIRVWILLPLVLSVITLSLAGFYYFFAPVRG